MAWYNPIDWVGSGIDWLFDNGRKVWEGPLNDLGFSNSESVEAGQDAYDDMAAKADSAYAQNEADLQRYYQTMADKYGGDEAKRREAIERYLNGDR